MQTLELRRPLSPAKGDLSITQSLAADFAHLGCLCFSKNEEGCDEENRGVNGVVRKNIWKLEEEG